MARRISTSQLRSKLRQIEQKQKRAIDDYNRAARQHNQKVRQAVNQYNQAVRDYNSRVRANQQRLRSELARLNRQPANRMVVYRTSAETLHRSYARLEFRAECEQLGPSFNRILDLSERETANSLAVANQLLGAGPLEEEQIDGLADAALGDQLRQISTDLDHRWQGAVFALNPNNPDAARHFCTSAREIFTRILETKAPDTAVVELMPDCERTDQGKPTRRSKIKYFLRRKGILEESLEDFVEQDMENIVQLFRVFNDATHGSAGTFNFGQLSAIKKRVEDGIVFLAEVIA